MQRGASTNQYRGTRLAQDARSRRACRSIRITVYTDVGLTAPSATIAAAFVRTDCRRYANCGDICTCTGSTRQQRRRRLPQLHRIGGERLARRQQCRHTATAFCTDVPGGMILLAASLAISCRTRVADRHSAEHPTLTRLRVELTHDVPRLRSSAASVSLISRASSSAAFDFVAFGQLVSSRFSSRAFSARRARLR